MRVDLDQLRKDYAAQYAQQQEEERIRMSVRWTVSSREVHTSKATWVGEKPKDGGVALLLEALQWARDNKQEGRMTLDLFAGGIRNLTFEQSEGVPSPVEEFDVNGVV